MDVMIWIVSGALIGAGIAIAAMFATSQGRKKALEDAFKAIGADALKANNESFLQLANLDFAKGQTQLKGLLDPMRALLEKQSETATGHEKTRAMAFTAIEEQIKQLMAGNTRLSNETSSLSNSLKSSSARGKWGEVHLKNIVELAGMTERCDFEEQNSVPTEAGLLRPDMTVHLPGGGTIVVDAKVPLKAYLESFETGIDAERASLLKQHVSAVEKYARDLSSKGYKALFKRQPRFVIMYMPVESAYVAAMQTKPELLEETLAKGVLLSTPTNLIALLRTISVGWREEDAANNTKEIKEAGETLYKRLGTFVEHLSKVGERIKQSNESYNKALGSLDRNVLPAARKLKDMNVTSEAEIIAPEQIDDEPRTINSDALPPPAAED
jgi:DNA recombination protein RmuC